MLRANLDRRNLILLLVGISFLAEAVRGISTGSATLLYRTVTRSGDGYLYWWSIIAGLILGAGSSALFILALSEPQYSITRTNWFLLLLGIFLLAETIRGIGTGNAILSVRTVTRSKNEYLYWFAISVGLILGIGSLVLFVITLFYPHYLAHTPMKQIS